MIIFICPTSSPWSKLNIGLSPLWKGKSPTSEFGLRELPPCSSSSSKCLDLWARMGRRRQRRRMVVLSMTGLCSLRGIFQDWFVLLVPASPCLPVSHAHHRPPYPPHTLAWQRFNRKYFGENIVINDYHRMVIP